MSDPLVIGFGRKKSEGKTIYANALLSDGKLLFWYTGDECHEYSFYKDFYYAGMNEREYFDSHKMEVSKIGFVDKTENGDLNSLIFEKLAPAFYSRFEIHEDSKGSSPCGNGGGQ